MSIKEQLLTESKDLKVDVKLDNIFESMDISDAEKSNFELAYESSVKTLAIKLAEQHISQIAESAELKINESTDLVRAEMDAKYGEKIGQFLDHVAQEYINENKVAVVSNLQAMQFNSLFGMLKEALLEHHVDIPEDKIDVVQELDTELTEQKAYSTKLYDELQESKNELIKIQKSYAIDSHTKDLTESQKEKVQELVESFAFGEGFEKRLTSIVEMVSKSTVEEDVDPINESTTINPEFKPEEVETVNENKQEQKPVNPFIDRVKSFSEMI